MPARADWCGPGAARALAAGGRGSVVAAFAGGGYVRLPGGYLLLAPTGSAPGPLTLLVDELQAPAQGAPVIVDRATLRVGPAAISVGNPRRMRRGSDGACAVGGGAHARPRSSQCARAALDAVAPAPALLRPGIEALRRGDLQAAAGALAGLGDGLTPAGDDVLAGYAAWRFAAAAPVDLTAHAASRASPLGLAYLDCAERGELPPFAARLVDAIAAGDAPAAGWHAWRARGWGSSSGAALVWGIAAGALGHAAARRPLAEAA